MCFKTAKLDAPSKKRAKSTHTTYESARYSVQAYEHDPRKVHVSIGGNYDGDADISEKNGAQVFGPVDLREFAKALTKLADELDA